MIKYVCIKLIIIKIIIQMMNNKKYLNLKMNLFFKNYIYIIINKHITYKLIIYKSMI